jgi:radical SAM-linked protein
MQRLRVRFLRGEELKFISHLDMMRLWQRALRRAGMPLAYSEGFNPHPRLSLAAPLQIGVTSEAELMDIFFAGWVSPHFFTMAIGQQLPHGVEVQGAHVIAVNAASLQSLVRFAEYRVVMSMEFPDMEARIAELLSLETLPWQHHRDTGPRSYDLRALIDALWLVDCQPDCFTLGMILRCDSRGSGRPEQVTAVLGLKDFPESIHRTRLVLETN